MIDWFRKVYQVQEKRCSNATADTWYQYGRTQALTAFINTPKLIVKVMAKDNPMYALDNEDMLIASGGTAGYCAVAKRMIVLMNWNTFKRGLQILTLRESFK